MSRIGAIIKKLYGEDVKSTTDINKAGVDMINGRPDRRQGKFSAFKKAISSRKSMTWIIRILVSLVILAIFAECIFQFNRFAAWETKVAARRADVDREYQRRKNLIPNIVLAVSRYAAYEQGVFRQVSEVRTELKKVKGVSASSAQMSNVLEKALSGLIALAEEYPDLKATNSIQDLIKEAANTEDRIAKAKLLYNAECEIYNQYLSVFPGNVFAKLYRYERAVYIGMDEDSGVIVIDLDMTGQKKEQDQEDAVNTAAEDITIEKTKI